MTSHNSARNESTLCLSCALCCNGALHNFTIVEPDEAAQLKASGLQIHQKGKQLSFDQPCAQLNDCQCTIYGDHPSACRTYRCKLLTELANGEVDLPAALRVVKKTRGLLNQIEALLPKDKRPLWPRAMAFVSEINLSKDPTSARRENAVALGLIAALGVVGKSRFLSKTATSLQDPQSSS